MADQFIRIGSGHGGGIAASVVGGVLTLDCGLGGPARIYEMVEKVELNSTGQTQYASCSYKIYLGTEDGVWDIINGFDTFDSGIDYATEFRVIGLPDDTAVVLRVSAVNEWGNEGAKSDPKALTSYVWAEPVRDFTGRHLTAGQTISSGGDWILDNDISTTITINAPGVFLRVAGRTLTHNGANHAIVVNSNATGFELDARGASFLHTGVGRGRAIAWASTNGPTGVNIYGDPDNDEPFFVDLNTDPGQCFGHTATDTYVDLNGARIHGFDFDANPQNSGSTDSLATVFRFVDSGRIYDFTGVVRNAGRDGAFYNPQNCEIWSFDVDLQSGDNITFHTSYESGGFNCYHDGTVRLTGTADHSRMFHFDRETGNRLINVRIVVTAAPTDISQVISPRGGLPGGGTPWIEIARLTIVGGSSGAIYGQRVGGDEPGGSFFGSTYMHGCDIPDMTAIGMYDRWTGVFESFHNVRLKNQTVEIGGNGGTWHSNEDNWVGAGQIATRTGLTTLGAGWTFHDSLTAGQFSGSTAGMVFAAVYTSTLDPTELPAKVSTPVTVSGVA